jgi:hypothetical protein
MSAVFSSPYAEEDADADDTWSALGDAFFEVEENSNSQQRNLYFDDENMGDENMGDENMDDENMDDDDDDEEFYEDIVYDVVDDDDMDVGVEEDEPTATATAPEIIDLTGDSDEDEEFLPALRRSGRVIRAPALGPDSIWFSTY